MFLYLLFNGPMVTYTQRDLMFKIGESQGRTYIDARCSEGEFVLA